MPEDEKMDAFGSPIGGEKAEEVKDEPKEGDDKKGDDKKDDKKVDDKELEKIKEHPFVKDIITKNTEYAKKLEDYGGNLANQGKLIKELKDFKENIEKNGGAGKKEDEDLFKEIKTSKDLTKEEKDDMTEGEIKAFDEIASLKKTINDLAKSVKNNKPEEKEKPSGVVDTEKVVDLNTEASTVAKELAGGDVEMANKIIFEFNQFAGNETLNKAQLKERMEKASKLVEGFKPQKEQTSVNKGGVVNNKNSKEDPFGVNAIVESVGSSKKKGSYEL